MKCSSACSHLRCADSLPRTAMMLFSVQFLWRDDRTHLRSLHRDEKSARSEFAAITSSGAAGRPNLLPLCDCLHTPTVIRIPSNWVSQGSTIWNIAYVFTFTWIVAGMMSNPKHVLDWCDNLSMVP
jgi:hypothetical protein